MIGELIFYNDRLCKNIKSGHQETIKNILRIYESLAKSYKTDLIYSLLLKQIIPATNVFVVFPLSKLDKCLSKNLEEIFFELDTIPKNTMTDT